MSLTFCDSHAHLNDEAFAGDLEQVLAACVKVGVVRIVNVGFDEKSSVKALEQATRHPALVATVGLHPHDARDFSPRTIDFLDSLCADPRVVAIGETGLDNYYDHSPVEKQKEALEAHLELAERVQLPVVIHCRDAYLELAETLKANYHPEHVPWHVHCFNGNARELAELIELDCYFSVGGMVTFKKFDGQELIRAMPADRLLLETDSPYLAPHPRRGRRNDPSLLIYTAQAMAAILEIELEELSRLTNENFNRIFRLGNDNIA